MVKELQRLGENEYGFDNGMWRISLLIPKHTQTAYFVLSVILFFVLVVFKFFFFFLALGFFH